MDTLLLIKGYEQFSCNHIKPLIQKGTIYFSSKYTINLHTESYTKGYTYFSHKVSSIEDCHKNHRHPAAKFAADNLSHNAWIQAQCNKVCQPNGQHVRPDGLCHFPSCHEASWVRRTKHDKRNGLYYSNKFSCAMFFLSHWNGLCLNLWLIHKIFTVVLQWLLLGSNSWLRT